ncbi:MAG: GDSL-type esterase/lipase family protein [Candidatus Omnitrophica bacterium]|nr:GDSL-type esterase/lipase family protein [Candidatus Omnitrophota bacterium]
MIYQSVELHNVEEVRKGESSQGVRLQRVPEELREKLNPGAQLRMLQPDNAEIRFLFDGLSCQVTLASEGQTRLTVFFGDFDSRQRFVIGQQPQTIEITRPAFLDKLPPEFREKMGFSPGVVRLILGGPQRDPVWFFSAQGKNIRPPEKNDLPAWRYLAYGTSITHGFDAEGPHLTYVGQTARLLGADLINLGVGGAAHCEPELADYLANRSDWNFASLELSVNMIGFDLKEFSRRVSYLVNRVASSKKERVVLCLTLYPFFLDFGIKPEGLEYKAEPEEYRQALREVVAQCQLPNVHLVEGPELLTNISNLTADLIHPGDYGMVEIAKNLTARFQEFLKKD